MKKTQNKGFTLFELLVVISIVGILLALGMVSFSTAQKKARDARRKEDIEAIQKALEQYYALEGQYPTSCYSSGSLTSGEMVIMQSFPQDPKGGDYSYTATNCSADSYCYCAQLEATTGNSGADCDWGADTKDYYCVSNRQ